MINKKDQFLIIISICASFIVMMTTHAATLAEPAGELIYVKGRVDITSPGAVARPANEGDGLNVGDVVRTKSNAKAGVRFMDGSILRMAPKSRIEIKEYAVAKGQAQARLKLWRGKAESIIKKLSGRIFGRKQKSWFEVHTPTAIIGVRGTDFITYYQQGISGAVFSEGQGYVYSLNRPDVVKFVNAGQSMLVLSPNVPPVIKPTTDIEIKKHRQDTSPADVSTPEGASMPPVPDVSVVPDQNLNNLNNLPLPGQTQKPIPTPPELPPTLPSGGHYEPGHTTPP